jgi:hypothetical protein
MVSLVKPAEVISPWSGVKPAHPARFPRRLIQGSADFRQYREPAALTTEFIFTRSKPTSLHSKERIVNDDGETLQ